MWPQHGEHEFREIVTRQLTGITTGLNALNEKASRIMTAQDDINATVTAVQGLVSDISTQVAQLGTDVTAIQAEIANLQGAGVDTSALNALVANLAGTQSSLDTAVSSVGSLVPPAPPAS